MFNFSLNDNFITILMWSGAALCVLAPAIHFTLAHLSRKREEEKERKVILKEFMEERKRQKMDAKSAYSDFKDAS